MTRRWPSAETGADGTYVLNLAPGEYRAFADHPEAAEALGLERRIHPGESTRCDFALEPGLSIHGVVLGEGDAPVDGCSVRALPSSVASTGAFGHRTIVLCSLESGLGSLGRETITGPTGEFKLSGLLEETYDLEGFIQLQGRGKSSEVPSGVSGVIIRLERGARVFGRIRPAPKGRECLVCAVRVDEDEDSRSVHETLHAARMAPDAWSGPFAGKLAPDPAAFEVADLAPGVYRVVLDVPGFRPFAGPALEVAPRDEIDMGTIPLARDEPIAGAVYAPDGRPAAHVSVIALSAGSNRYSTPAAEARTGPDGSFKLHGLAEGNYDIDARSSDWAPARLEAVPAGSLGIELVLEAGLLLDGHVVEAGSGEPIPGAAVEAFPMQQTQTDSRGSFRLGGLAASIDPRASPVRDRLLLTARKPGYILTRVAVPWPPREPCRVSMKRSPSIFGKVQREDGTFVPNATVRLTVPGVPDPLVGDSSGHRTSSDSNGSYALELGPDLEGLLLYERVLLIGESEARDSLALAEVLRSDLLTSPELERNLIFPTRNVLVGRVVDVEGTPVSSADVEFHAKSPSGDPTVIAFALGLLQPLRRARTGSDGVFDLGSIPPGAYLVEACKGRLVSGFMEHLVADGEGTGAARSELVMEIRSGRTVRGLVHEQGGSPIQGAQVLVLRGPRGPVTEGRLFFLARECGGFCRTFSGQDGSYTLEVVPEEEVILAARSPGHEVFYTRLQPGSVEQDIVLLPLVDVTGRVTCAETDAPVTAFRAEIVRTQMTKVGNRTVGRPAGDGSFVFARVPAGGPYEVRIESEKHVPFATRFEVTRDLRPLEIELEKGHSIEGRILDDSSDEPLSDVQVVVAAQGSSRKTLSAEDGSFEVSGLIATEAALSFSHPARVTLEKKIRLSQSISLGDVRLPAAAHLDLTVESLPKGSAEVHLDGGTGARPVVARPREGGLFEFRGLPDGAYRIRVRASGFYPFDGGEVELTKGSRTSHRISFASTPLPAGSRP